MPPRLLAKLAPGYEEGYVISATGWKLSVAVKWTIGHGGYSRINFDKVGIKVKDIEAG